MKKLFVILVTIPCSALFGQGDFGSGGGGGTGRLGNGDFETNTFDFTKAQAIFTEGAQVGAFEYYDPTATSTSWTSAAGVYRLASDGVGNNASVIGVGSGSSVFQDFQLTEGGSFDVAWSMFMQTAQFGEDPTSIAYDVTLTNLANNEVLLSKSFVESFDSSVSNLSEVVTVKSSDLNTSLRLALTRTGSEKALLFSDDVSVEVSTVPEPSAAMLVMLATAGLFGRRR